jgi:hypothetical protein
MVRRTRSRRSCAIGDRGAGNQDLGRHDRGPTRFSGVDTAHGRRCRARRVGQSGAAESGACIGVAGFSGRPGGTDIRLRRLGRPSAVSPEIVDAAVSVRDLRWVLSVPFSEPNPRVLDAAWRRLEREAAKSPGRRATHEVTLAAGGARSGLRVRRDFSCAGYRPVAAMRVRRGGFRAS